MEVQIFGQKVTFSNGSKARMVTAMRRSDQLSVLLKDKSEKDLLRMLAVEKTTKQRTFVLERLYIKYKKARDNKLETDIEDDAVKLGYRFEFVGLKFKSPSLNGGPDRIFLGNNEHIFFIEFKKKDGRLKANQIQFHKGLRKKGFRVYVCWHLKEAEKVFERERAIYTERLQHHSD